MKTKIVVPVFPAFLEITRKDKSRAELKRSDKIFKTDPIFKKIYRGLKGRKFWFEFASEKERDEVFGNLQKLIEEKQNQVQTTRHFTKEEQVALSDNLHELVQRSGKTILNRTVDKRLINSKKMAQI